MNIGLGTMGGAMSANLIKKGFSVQGYDIAPEALERFEKAGGVPCSDMAAAAKGADIVFTMLPNGPHVEQAVEKIVGSMAKGALFVDCSTILPEVTLRVGARLRAEGMRVMDAPVGRTGAEALLGKLLFMVGGEESAFERAKPYFEAIGSSAMRIGPAGSGSVTKLANQIIVNLNIAAVSEALVLAAKAGADPALVYEAIRGGLAGSQVLDAKAPMMLHRDFQPGGKISINHKDIKNVMASAHALDVPLPLTALLFEIMQALKVAGHENEDHSAIVKFFEGLANVTVQSREMDKK